MECSKSCLSDSKSTVHSPLTLFIKEELRDLWRNFSQLFWNYRVKVLWLLATLTIITVLAGANARRFLKKEIYLACVYTGRHKRRIATPRKDCAKILLELTQSFPPVYINMLGYRVGCINSWYNDATATLRRRRPTFRQG